MSHLHVDGFGAGHCFNPPVYVATGTLADGTWEGAGLDCVGWTSQFSGDNGATGAFCSTGPAWTAIGVSQCSSLRRVYCFQTDSGRALEFFTDTHKRVFVTDGLYAPVIDSLNFAAADAICNSEASGEGLSGSYRAILSESSTDARDRLPAGGPYVRLDGIKVVDTAADLFTAESLDTGINVTPTLAYVTRSEGVWTGTNDDGTASSETCGDWAAGASTGQIGKPTILSQIFSSSSLACTDDARLYCLEE